MVGGLWGAIGRGSIGMGRSVRWERGIYTVIMGGCDSPLLATSSGSGSSSQGRSKGAPGWGDPGCGPPSLCSSNSSKRCWAWFRSWEAGRTGPVRGPPQVPTSQQGA